MDVKGVSAHCAAMKPFNRKFAGVLTLAITANFITIAPLSAIGQDADHWLDEPRSVGDWSYRQNIDESRAQYLGAGGELFSLTCKFSAQKIQMDRPVAAARAGMMRIRTETGDRVFNATPNAGANTVSIMLNQNDPLLDAMAITKGRFAVELEGAPTLYLPSWAEVTRVIEDCR